MILKNVIDVLVGLIIVVAVVMICNNWYQRTRIPGERDHYKLYASFTDMTGLEIGSDVRISGIPVGYVSGYTLDTKSYMATVVIEIHNSVSIPLDTMASVASDGLFGKKYLKLAPGSNSVNYKPDEIINLTQPPMSLEGLINGLLFKNNG